MEWIAVCFSEYHFRPCNNWNSQMTRNIFRQIICERWKKNFWSFENKTRIIWIYFLFLFSQFDLYVLKLKLINMNFTSFDNCKNNFISALWNCLIYSFIKILEKKNSKSYSFLGNCNKHKSKNSLFLSVKKLFSSN